MNRTTFPRRPLEWLLNRGRLPSNSDADLLELFALDGDELAFEELVHRHGPMVHGVCRRRLNDPADIADAFQATFMVLVRRAGSLGREPRVAAWLHAVAVHVADRARIGVNRRARQVPIVGEVGPIAPEVPDLLEKQELCLAIDNEIARLPERQRAVVVLCWLEGYTHQQAALQLGLPLGTVKSRLDAARGRLRDRLQRRGLAPSVLPVVVESVHVRTPITLVADTLAAVRSIAGAGLNSATNGASSATILSLSVMRDLKRFATIKPWLLGMAAVTGLIAAPNLIPRQEPVAIQPQALGGVTRKEEPTQKRLTDRLGDPLPAGAIARIGTIRYRQADGIARIAISPDGRSIITDAGERTLNVWDVGHGRPVRSIDPRLDSIRSFQLSPDGKTIAVAGFYFDPLRRLTIHQVAFLDAVSGRAKSSGEWDGRGVFDLAYAPDSRTVATLSDDGTVRLWDTETARIRLQLKVGERGHHGLAFSPDGRLLAVGTFGNEGDPFAVHLIDTATGRIQRTIDRLPTFAYCLAFAPDGKTIALAASNEGQFALWDVLTGREIRRMGVKSQNIEAISFTPDGKTLATVADSGELSIWDPSTGQKVRAIRLPRTVPAAAAFTPDGKRLATNGGSTVLHLFDLADGQDRFEVPDTHQADVHAIVFSNDGKLLVTAGDDGQARAWDFQTGRPRSPVLRHESWVRAIALSADGRRLLTGASWPDGKVRLWGLRTGELIREWAPPPGQLHYPVAVTFGKQGGSVLACFNTGRLSRWDPESGAEQETVQPRFERERNPMNDDLAPIGSFSPAGDSLAALTHFGGGLLVADLASGTQRFRSQTHMASAYSPSGRLIGIGRSGKPVEIKLSNGLTRIDGEQADGIVTVLDATTGKEMSNFVIPRSWIAGIAFSPDERFVAASTYFEGGRRSGGVHVFRRADGAEILKFDVPSACSPALAFSPDGKRLVGGLRDTSVLIWDVSQAR